MTNKEVSEQLMKDFNEANWESWKSNVAPDITMEDMASGDKKHDAGGARAREKPASLCVLQPRKLKPSRCRRCHREHHAPARKSALGGDRQVQRILVGGADGERMRTHATMSHVQRGVE